MHIFNWLKENLNCEDTELFLTQVKYIDESQWDSSSGLVSIPLGQKHEIYAKSNSEHMSAFAVFWVLQQKNKTLLNCIRWLLANKMPDASQK